MVNTRSRLIMALATSSAVFAGCLIASPAHAETLAVPELGSVRSRVVSDFRSHLVAAADAGDAQSAEQLSKLDALTAQDRLELGRYLAGETQLSAASPSPDAVMSVEGDTVIATNGAARWTSRTDSDLPIGEQTRGATYNVHSSADETFTLAGITISRTRVWSDYVTGSGKVLQLKDYGCQLVSNYDPFSTISISKQSGLLSGGQATYKCYVVVKRGVPTPWGQINTTTRSSYQYMRVNGPGIQAHGWM